MDQYPCCPKNSEPALQTTYQAQGKDIMVGDLPVYTIGQGCKAIIMIYDIFGTHGGRTRAICDSLALQGYTVYLPDLFRGNAWSANKPLDIEFISWLKGFSIENIQKDVIETLLPYAKQEGKTSFGIIGFCWGVWVAFNLCASKEFKCGVGVHPSLPLAEHMNQTEEGITKAVSCPQMIIAAGNDKDNIKPGGPLMKILTDKFGDAAKCYYYDKVVHGFFPRGDLEKPEIKEAVESSWIHIKDYLNEHLN